MGDRAGRRARRTRGSGTPLTSKPTARFLEVPEQQRSELLRFFLGNEMAAVGNDHAGHIGRDQAQRLFRLAATPACLGPAAADREHRHRQAEARIEQGMVVRAVARNVAVVGEACAERSRLAVRSELLVDVGLAEDAALP